MTKGGREKERSSFSGCVIVLLGKAKWVCSCSCVLVILSEVRWCHTDQVTLFGEPSCQGAVAVPLECQSVIIILMTRIALLAMSSLVCAKANEQHPNCKINWKTFWLKTTLPTPGILHLHQLSFRPVPPSFNLLSCVLSGFLPGPAALTFTLYFHFLFTISTGIYISDLLLFSSVCRLSFNLF